MKIKTIFSMGLSRNSHNKVILHLEDDHSGDSVADIEMSLEELSLLLTGLHGVKGETTFYPNANIAMKREIQTLCCDKVGWDKETQRQEVMDHFDRLGLTEEGWAIFSDGTLSQQNGFMHHYHIKKYTPVKDPLIVERHY